MENKELIDKFLLENSEFERIEIEHNIPTFYFKDNPSEPWSSSGFEPSEIKTKLKSLEDDVAFNSILKHKGVIMMDFPYKHFEKVKDLLYYDGPILSEFRKADRIILYNWVDCSSWSNRWMIWEVTEQELSKYLSNGKSLLDLITENKDGWVVLTDLDSDAEPLETRLVKLSEVPEEYLPGVDSFHE